MMFLETSALKRKNNCKIFTDLAVEILAKVTNGEIDLQNDVITYFLIPSYIRILV